MYILEPNPTIITNINWQTSELNLLATQKNNQALLLSQVNLLCNEKEKIYHETSIEKETWLKKMTNHIMESLSDFEFTLERLSRLIFLSPRQIRRKLKKLTGKTFSQYLKEARLKAAYQILIHGKAKSIKQLAYKVGLRDTKHFSKQFKLYFGKSPSTFL